MFFIKMNYYSFNMDIEDLFSISDELNNIIQKLKINRQSEIKRFITKKTKLITEYNDKLAGRDIDLDKKFYEFMRRKSRGCSGVSVLTVMTEPYFRKPDGTIGAFSCENYDCDYCPDASINFEDIPEDQRGFAKPNKDNMVILPRSYPFGAPMTNRAIYCNFDLEKQIKTRLEGYQATGNPISKLEVIISGGTWHSYPKEYRYDFIRRLYYYCNTYGDEVKREMYTLREEIVINRSTRCNIIGLTPETRPDQISFSTLKEAREQGITRFQIGFQTHDDRLLKRINRKCYQHHAKRACKLLKANGFKFGAHIMTDLPLPLKPEIQSAIDKSILGKSKDVRRRILLQLKPCDIDDTISMEEYNKRTLTFLTEDCTENDWFHPDDLKIYPTMATRDTQIYKWKQLGLYEPTGDTIYFKETHPHIKGTLMKKDFDKLKPSQKNNYLAKYNPMYQLLKEYLPKIPRWIRISRITREFQRDHVKSGIFAPNLSQMLITDKVDMKDIRSREIGRNKGTLKKNEELILKTTKYTDNNGDEYFLEYIDSTTDHIYGFLRLRLCKSENDLRIFDELYDSALIRELHVYSQTLAVGTEGQSYQHQGIGSQLLKQAEYISRDNGFNKISVIAGTGTYNYYCHPKRGFYEGTHYLHKNIPKQFIEIILITIILFILF